MSETNENRDASPEILIVQTGGTIDKDYPRRSKGYAFEITDSAAHRILQRIKPSFEYKLVTLCKEDSQDITLVHRQKLEELCQNSPGERILITHGTDTLIETAQFLAKNNLGKVIVLAGSFKPETFKDSDAEFNVGFALGCLQTIRRNGVYVAMNGATYEASQCCKDGVTGNFGRRPS